MSAKYLLLLAAVIAVCKAQAEPSIQNALGNVTLPPELQGKVDPKAVEEAQAKVLNEFKARCDKNGGPDAYVRAKNASTTLTQCVSSLVNGTALQQEIEEAKPNGTVDEVFKKYCQKKPLFEGCVKDFTDSATACFSDKEQGHLRTGYNVSLQLAEFICFKEGDRIALFIAEGGQECFQDKQEALKECANKTLGLGEGLDLNSLSNTTLSFDEKQCKQLTDLQSCVVGVLETCPKPTSANIVESLFKFIKKSTPCKDFVKDEEAKARSHNHKAETQKGGAPAFYVTTATLITAVFATLLI